MFHPDWAGESSELQPHSSTSCRLSQGISHVFFFCGSIMVHHGTCTHVYMYTCIHVYIYTYIYIYLSTCILIFFYTYILLYLYTYILIYLYTYMYIYIYLYLYIYIFIYIFIYIHYLIYANFGISRLLLFSPGLLFMLASIPGGASTGSSWSVHSSSARAGAAGALVSAVPLKAFKEAFERPDGKG